MKKRFNVGLIGCGRISVKHIEGIAANYLEMNLCAVSDLIHERMDRAISDYHHEIEKRGNIFANKKLKKYHDYQKLLKDKEIDIVIIGTESGYHASITVDALNANKHVIVEKPMALSISEARKMITVAKEKDLKLAVCHQNRFNPTIQHLKEAIDRGRFGKLVHAVASVRWNRNDHYYSMDNWHGTLALDGGILINQCIHNIDILRWFLGDIERVYAESDNFLRNIETEDAAMAVLRFKSGVIAVIEGTVCVYPSNLEETFNIFGEKGTVRIAGIALNQIKDWKFADSREGEENEMKRFSYETESAYGYGHNLLFKDFLNAIKYNEKPLVDGEEGKKAIELVLGIYKSAKKGKIINLPLDDYSTTSRVSR
ncbi:Gfo/Idh/MocA family protein [Natronospora cellulosivora (SeqCode)]